LVQVQNRDGLFEEPGVGGLLPAAILPRFDLLGLKPALHGRRGDGRDDAPLDDGLGEITRGPARQGFTRVAGQRAGEGGDARPNRGGKKSAARLAAELPDTPALPGCGSATCGPSDQYSPRPGQWPRYSSLDVRRPAAGSLRAPLPRT